MIRIRIRSHLIQSLIVRQVPPVLTIATTLAVAVATAATAATANDTTVTAYVIAANLTTVP